MNIKEIRRKRIIRENIEAWNRHNRKFLREMDKEIEEEVFNVGTRTWSYTPGVGVIWSDSEIQQFDNMSDF